MASDDMGRSDEGSYLTVFCLFGLIYDVCYELAVIVEFGSVSETGWGDVSDSAAWRILKEKLSAQRCSNSQMRCRRFSEESVKEGLPDPLSRERCPQS